MSTQTVSRPTPRAVWHHGPAWLWLLSFVICFGGDALLGRWVLLPNPSYGSWNRALTPGLTSDRDVVGRKMAIIKGYR